MDTKGGTLEESILGVWKDAVDDLDEKYTDAQRAAREKSRTGGREHGGSGVVGKERSDDEAGHKAKRRMYPAGSAMRHQHDGKKRPNNKDQQAKMKMKLLQKKQKAERDRARNEELDLEILELEKMIEGLENSPNPANSQHLCAKNVVHEEWGSGQTIPTMHADPDEDGDIAWYDVMFEHGIEEGVLISELKVTKSEMHLHSSKKKKNEAMDKVDKKALKKDFDDRAKEGDGDIDNDGDEDESDKYLHKKRQAISKSMKETWAEAVRKVKENENGNGEDPSDEDDEDEKKNGKKAKVEINPKMDVDEKKK